jgi:hypothetical protein
MSARVRFLKHVSGLLSVHSAARGSGMIPEEAQRAELGARILVAHFSGDQRALEGTLKGVLGSLVTLADAFTLVAIKAGSLIGEMAQVNLDVALRRLGDSEIQLLPVGDADRRSAISLATAMAGGGGPGSPTPCLATRVNSAFGLAVDSVAAAAQGAETTPIRVAQAIADSAHKGLAAGDL